MNMGINTCHKFGSGTLFDIVFFAFYNISRCMLRSICYEAVAINMAVFLLFDIFCTRYGGCIMRMPACFAAQLKV